MNEKNKKILMMVVGGGLLIAIIYYFFMSNNSQGVRAPFGAAPSAPSNTPPATPTTVIYQGGGSAFPSSGSSSSLYVRRGTYSAESLRLQRHLNTFVGSAFGGVSVQRITEDGLVGPNTFTRIKIQFPTIGANAERNSGLSKSEFDAIMATTRASASASTPSAPALGGSSSCGNVNPISDSPTIINNYIACRTGLTMGTINTWTINTKREWAAALRANQATFYCSQCWNTGTYSTRTGTKI